MLAVIDVGTNSVRAIWRDVDDGRIVEDIRYTRLGEAASASGYIQDEALLRTIAGIRSLLAGIPVLNHSNFCLTATSAVREACNRSAVVAEIEAACGFPLVVLSAETEAQLGFLGAVHTCPTAHPPMVLDIGGGSTELTWQSAVFHAASVPIGAVRLHDMPKRYSPLADYLAPLLSRVPSEPFSLVGTGGTITTLAAMSLQMETYDAARIHGTVLTAEALSTTCDVLSRMTTDARRTLPGLPHARADIIDNGLDILLTVLAGLKCDSIVVSATDMLHALLQLGACPPGE